MRKGTAEKLKKVEAGIASGLTLEKACKAAGTSMQTWYAHKNARRAQAAPKQTPTPITPRTTGDWTDEETRSLIHSNLSAIAKVAVLKRIFA